jgi:hypothetical protein
VNYFEDFFPGPHAIPDAERKVVSPLLVERTGFAPWISVFRYSLDTILECGSLLPLFRHPQVFLNRAGVILSESPLLALRRGLRSEGSQLFVPRMESRLAGN